jgi:S-adenosylmethionine:tRNA ribosyltransferase-isomerase
MKAGTDFKRPPEAVKLLHVDEANRRFRDHAFPELPALLRKGDVLVVNDAATLPASLRSADGQLELRLAGELDDGAWRAVLFGPGDFRDRTEDRPAPPRVEPRQRLEVGGLTVVVERVSDLSPRLLTVRFEASGPELWRALYRAGRPVQYSYIREPLPLAAVQTGYAARPWAMEMPSAGRALRWPTLRALLGRGVTVASLTHAAGLSATGDPQLDAALPLPERYELPQETVRAVQDARRVVAVGTTVVRALEGNARSNGGALRAGRGETDLVIGPQTQLNVVDGILSGMHEPGSSHFELLSAFAPQGLLLEAANHAEEAGYLVHELGDSTLVLAE